MITEISLSQPLLTYGWAFLTRQLDVFSLLSDSFQYYADKNASRLSGDFSLLNKYLMLDTSIAGLNLDSPLSQFLDFDPNRKSALSSLAYSIVSSYIVFGMLKKVIPVAIVRVETEAPPKLKDVINLVIDNLRNIKPLDAEFFIDKAQDERFNMIAFMAKEDLLLALVRLKKGLLESNKDLNESLEVDLRDAYVKSFVSLGLPKDINAPFWATRFSTIIQKADEFMHLKTRDFRAYNFLSYFFFLSDHFATYTLSKRHFFNVFKEINRVLIHDESISNIFFAFMKYTNIFFDKSDKDNVSNIESRFLNKSCFAKKELSSVDTDTQDIDLAITLYMSNSFLEGIDLLHLTFDPSIVLNTELDDTDDIQNSDNLPDVNYDETIESEKSRSQSSVSTLVIFGGVMLVSGLAFYLYQKTKNKKTK